MPKPSALNVVQLDQLIPEWTLSSVGIEQWLAQSQLQRQQFMDYAPYWFSYEQVVKRVQYVVPTTQKSK